MKNIPGCLLSLICMAYACTAPKQTRRQIIDEARYNSRLADSLARKQQNGIEFHAQGNQPASWTLDMDVDKSFDFKSADGNDIHAYPVQAARVSDPKALSYTTPATSGPMNILIYDESCAGNEKEGRKVEVTVNNKRYTGCGNDLYDYRINDIWVLIKAGGIFLNKADFPKGLPRMEFNLVNKQMLGSDGCNGISAPIAMHGSRMEFGNISGLSSSCKNNIAQKIFSEKVSNKSADYYFKDGQLYLYLADDSLLIFAKTD